MPLSLLALSGLENVPERLGTRVSWFLREEREEAVGRRSLGFLGIFVSLRFFDVHIFYWICFVVFCLLGCLPVGSGWFLGHSDINIGLKLGLSIFLKELLRSSLLLRTIETLVRAAGTSFGISRRSLQTTTIPSGSNDSSRRFLC